MLEHFLDGQESITFVSYNRLGDLEGGDNMKRITQVGDGQIANGLTPSSTCNLV